MGCVNSKADINDRHPNIFQVTNVNDQLRPISPGKLQVTETELVFYQRRKTPTKWPLRSLRKYGFDTEVFSFECGRRCPTGQGIYAFQCRKAEQLFNIVHQRITGNVAGVDGDANPNEPQVIARRPNVAFQTTTEGYLNPVAPVARPHNSVSRPGSVSSNSPLSPTATSPPPTTTTDNGGVCAEHNNNKRGSLVTAEPTYTNASVVVENGSALPPPYVNLTVPDATMDVGHVYMNVETSQVVKEEAPVNFECVEERHCYANIDSRDLESLRHNDPHIVMTVPPTPTTLAPYADNDYVTVHEVNYAELDLDPSERLGGGGGVLPAAAAPTEEGPKGYATIDFQKTTALSQSINPAMTEEEGSRKTRHNSTIHYNNSLSD